MKNKVVIIGAGHVGSHCAYALAMDGTAEEIILIDKDERKAESQAFDVADSVSFMQKSVLIRAGRYEDVNDTDIVVIAVGKPRMPGQTRLDLLVDSVDMAREVADHLKEYNYKGIVITITNPADIIADCIRKRLEAKRWRVFGTGTLLDTGRLLRTLSEETGVDRRSIQAFSLGEHGDSSMIPFSSITIGGVPFEQYPDIDREHLLRRTRGIGMDIINGKGSTEFGIGIALATMVRAVLRDEKKVLPASVLLEGEYGQQGVHCGVPCIIGRNGIEKIVQLKLNKEEQEMLNASCLVIKKHIEMADHQPEKVE